MDLMCSRGDLTGSQLFDQDGWYSHCSVVVRRKWYLRIAGDLWWRGQAGHVQGYPPPYIQLISKCISLVECSERNGKLVYQNHVYVPNYMPLKLQIIKDFYDSPGAGHPGRLRMLELISQ